MLVINFEDASSPHYKFHTTPRNFARLGHYLLELVISNTNMEIWPHSLRNVVRKPKGIRRD